MNLFRGAILSLLFYCFALETVSQNLGFRFETISVDQGLSQTSVWSILQDRDGFIWIGTADGLNRYDGYTFTVFRHNPQDPSSLTNNNVATLAHDNDGNIWIGSRSGLEKYELVTGTFSRLANTQKYKGTFLDTLIGKVFIDRDGVIWTGGISELGRLNPATGTIETFPRIHQLIALPNNIRPLLEDSDGDIWIGTMEGFLLYDRKSGELGRVKVPGMRDPGYGMIAYESRDGVIWLGTSKSQLVSYEKKNNAWRVWTNLPASLTSVNFNSFRSICEDEYGGLWLGTQYSGLFLLDRAAETFIRFIPVEGGKSNTRYEGVIQIYRDRSGLLSVGYDGAGIVKITPHPNKFPLIQFPLTGGTGTGDNFFKSIMVDRSGVIWAGTFDKGLKVFDRRSDSLKTFLHRPEDPRSLRSNTVLSLYEDREGDIWVGTINGVDVYERATSTFRHLTMPRYEGPGAGVLTGSSICEDGQGTVWIGSTPGLIVCDSSKSRLSFMKAYDSSGAELRLNVDRLQPAREGGLWIGTNANGLIKLPKGGGALHQSESGNIYLSRQRNE
ncbi:MAG TPA: two-component regulator propeller domain-containing protein [Bacteroidota bacterium]|jgi:ligand-binding sensor domain-containing protein|nr:two-component regulator propeller domain-containing protein [Bacteroidota bacterium]